MVWLAIYLVGWAVPDGANVSQDILVTIQCVGLVAIGWNNYPDGKTVKGNIEGNV